MFLLVKWYGDVVTDQGTGAIVYAAQLRWGLLCVRYAATLVVAPGSAPREAATRRRVELPRQDGHIVTWRNASLRIAGTWLRDAQPIEHRLTHGSGGTLEWTCHMPRARASVQIGDTRLDGLGYVESLRLFVPPWKMPFRTLRWGRHVSTTHWLVWIDWAGGEERRWVWLDGVEQPAAVLADDGLQGLTESRQLHFGPGRNVRDRAVLATIRGPLPALARRLAGPLARMHERKRLAPSSIVQMGRPLDYGWSIYEEVAW
jgi:hypothetical protein